MKYAVILCATGLALPALAHPGHGLGGSHWHASDAWGFGVAAALAVVAVWLARGGK